MRIFNSNSVIDKLFTYTAMAFVSKFCLVFNFDFHNLPFGGLYPLNGFIQSGNEKI
jgi:hypothetical protein